MRCQNDKLFLREPLVGAAQLFSRSNESGYYWLILFGLTLPGLPFILWKARSARVTESRRVRLFVASLVIGLSPILLAVLLEGFLPRFHQFLSDPVADFWARVLVYAPLLLVPVMTAYSVLVNQVLNVKLVIRRALQYALARYSVLAAALLPFLGLLGYLYWNRQETLTALLSGKSAAALGGATLLGLITFRVRDRFFDSIDRRFFREQYDSRQILAGLVGRSREVGDGGELCRLLSDEIDRALHVESLGVFLLDETGQLADPAGEKPALGLAWEIVQLLSSRIGPLDVDLEADRAPERDLPQKERDWLADTGFRILVPMLTVDGSLLGLIGLGDKRSELPFSRNDRMLLTAIASSAALALENQLLRSTPVFRTPARDDAGVDSRASTLDENLSGVVGGKTKIPQVGVPSSAWTVSTVGSRLAVECPSCGVIYPSETTRCQSCSTRTTPSTVPCILGGKFKFEKRIGAGGMGIVYRAVDLTLGRAVAVKTLPRMAPRYAVRLRREARAIAAVTHPNLALIFGAETWRGMPMLIFEYLPGSTLASRLEKGPFSLSATLDLGIVLADVISSIHGVGILHRDIKPSNIGFTQKDEPKLLDFGLAKLLNDTFRREDSPPGGGISETSEGSRDTRSTISISGQIVGTPLYLAPEAMKKAPPDQSLDLWSLNMVLYETLAGTHPFRSLTLQEVLRHISRASVPDIRSYRPDCPDGVAKYFHRVFAAKPRHRFSNARELRAGLEDLGRRYGQGQR